MECRKSGLDGECGVWRYGEADDTSLDSPFGSLTLCFGLHMPYRICRECALTPGQAIRMEVDGVHPNPDSLFTRSLTPTSPLVGYPELSAKTRGVTERKKGKGKGKKGKTEDQAPAPIRPLKPKA